MKKLKGTTIIESIVALMIITLIMGVSLMIMGKHSGSSRNSFRYIAQVEVQNLYYESFQKKNPMNETLEKEGMRIELAYNEHLNWKALLIVDCSVFDVNNRLIYERHWLIPAK